MDLKKLNAHWKNRKDNYYHKNTFLLLIGEKLHRDNPDRNGLQRAN